MLRRDSLAYLDSSAIVKLVLVESESAALGRFLAGFPRRATSILARVEVIRAVRGADPLAIPLARATLDSIRTVELDDAVVVLASQITPPLLRSLDAIHVASALLLQPDLDVLVSYDHRMLEVARAAGVPTATPV